MSEAQENIQVNTSEEKSKDVVPEEFEKIIKDFVKDILITYPEYKDELNQDLKNVVCDIEGDESLKTVLAYCQGVYPERFFDILYQNEEIFTDEKIDTNFLPDLEFSDLWKCDISEKTRETIWKYLQLILFTIIGSVRENESFGDTAKLFEAINEDEFKKKLEETIGQMHNLFDASNVEMGDASGINLDELPDASKIHEHISGMLDGKLGTLAREIAAETAEEFKLEMSDETNVQDVFQKLFKNPGKLINLVKTVGSKLDNKIKSGEIKESELIKEAGDIMNKMKDMPGMDNIQGMLNKMGVPGAGKNSKVNMNAFQAHMNRNMKQAKMRERMQQKLQERQRIQEEELQRIKLQETQGVSVTNQVFSTGEIVEKTPCVVGGNKKKKRNRRKKNKGKNKNKN